MEKLIVIKKTQDLQQLKEYIKSKDYLAFDTETTGTDDDAKIIGYSISGDIDIGYYVILSYWDVESQKLIDLETKESTKEIMEMLVGKHLVMHNAPFDVRMVQNNYRVDLRPHIHTDTMILGHVLDENRSNALKELGVSIFGEDAKAEQTAMKESVQKNGGKLTKDVYELYKADAELLGRYGAKDAILTIKLFYHFIEELYAQELDDFFYNQEAMPLLRGPTCDLNNTGLKVDPAKLEKLKGELEADCMEAKAFIYKEITPIVAHKYPGTKPGNTFNIGATQQMAWLLFIQLGNEFTSLTKGGKDLCKALGLKAPYTWAAKREFIDTVQRYQGRVYQEAAYNPKTKKMGRPKKVGKVESYLAADKATLKRFASKYKWVERFLEYNKSMKLLSTYVEGIQSRMRYNIIRPSFLQHGTTSGRYSSKNPNFQNLPRDDKRVKACIISRPGKSFVGADYSQLEPRVFASISNDTRLQKCFESGDDFYSVVGAPIFGKFGIPLKKDAEGSFAKLYPQLRDKAKVISLATPYGRTAAQQASVMGISRDESQELINAYWEEYPEVKKMMEASHKEAIDKGVVYSLYNRPRRIPRAKAIPSIYGKTQHSDLPYEARTLLNLAMNHRVQSTAASIVNRASIAFYERIQHLGIKECHIVLQVHDEIVVECRDEDAETVKSILKDCMENTLELPGVKLEAKPVIAKNLADLK